MFFMAQVYSTIYADVNYDENFGCGNRFEYSGINFFPASRRANKPKNKPRPDPIKTIEFRAKASGLYLEFSIDLDDMRRFIEVYDTIK